MNKRRRRFLADFGASEIVRDSRGATGGHGFVFNRNLRVLRDRLFEGVLTVPFPRSKNKGVPVYSGPTF